MLNNVVAIFINVDWYFKLHWLDRANFFKAQGYEVHIVANFSDAVFFDELISHGFCCHETSLQRRSLLPFHEISSFIELFKIIKKINPSIIHCVTIKPNIYVGLLNRFLFNHNIIYSVTGLGVVFSSNRFKFRLLKCLVTFLYKMISTSKSAFVFENTDDFKIFENINILKNNGFIIKGAGVDLQRYAVSPLPNNRHVLFAARLLEEKGLRLLIDARKKLSQEDILFEIKVAGIIDNKADSAVPLKDIEQWHENGDITWLGTIHEMPELISSCDIVCLPTSYGEGVPRILIEAAACQRGIITTNIGGCRELIEHDISGLLVSPNVDSLSISLKRMLGDTSLLASCAKEARNVVEAEFSQEIVFNQFLDLYKLFNKST